MPKISAKKPARKDNRKKSSRGLGLFCLFLLVVATLTAGLYFMVLYPGKPPGDPLPLLRGQAKHKTLPQTVAPLSSNQPAPLYEKPNLPQQMPQIATSPKKTLPGRPLVAIIIDDMGYRQNTGMALLALDLPLSFSFLPFTPFSDELQKEAQARGRDILLHLPLEPVDQKLDPGPGALTAAMDPETMRSIFHQDLQTVPRAIGINSHMGSRFTANPQAMRTLLALVRTRNIFFLDSMTSSQSVAYDLAREMGVKTERRTVFLDNDQNLDKIMAQLDLLVKHADKHGQAVGIGHPYPATVEALRRYQAQLRARTEMVGVSRLVH